MPLRLIPPETSPSSGWNLDDLEEFPTIDDLAAEVETARHRAAELRDVPVDDLLGFFESLSTSWLETERAFLQRFSGQGIGFVLSFLRTEQLAPLLDLSFRGDRHHVDGFVPSCIPETQLTCVPRGTVVHWLAGNVPMLGFLSLVGGLITGNANVVKLPRQSGRVLPAVLGKIRDHEHGCANGTTLSGEALVGATRMVYCEADDASAQAQLSSAADVRVAWGGREAVRAVVGLPKAHSTEDLVFGPRYSFAVVGREALDGKDTKKLAARLAIDASLFDQHGCNSPHTVFVEEGGDVSPAQFAQLLAGGMATAAKRIPKGGLSAGEAMSILNVRAEYELDGEVFASSGTEWTVVYSDDEGMADPCFSRVLFVRPVTDADQVLSRVTPKCQTVGLAMGPDRGQGFARKLATRGVDRVTSLGRMSMYNYPWDGVFPASRMVRWVSFQSPT